MSSIENPSLNSALAFKRIVMKFVDVEMKFPYMSESLRSDKTSAALVEFPFKNVSRLE